MDFAPFVDFPLLSFVLCGLLMVELDPSAEFEIDIAFIQVMRCFSFHSSFSMFATWWKA